MGRRDLSPTPEEIHGHERKTTNNRMELRAAIEGLRHLKAASRVRLYSDSAYLIDPLKKGWPPGGRRTAGRRPTTSR